MSAVTADLVLDFAVSKTPCGDTLEFGFFGGEPFLRLDLMRRLAARARERAHLKNIPLRLRVTTNGTLLDEAALSFLEENAVALCVSIDGPPKIHDRHRRFEDGRGCGKVVVTNLCKALKRLEHVQVNCVYGPDAIDTLPDTVAFFDELGARLIHLNLDITTTWPTESFARLRDAYLKVANQVIACYRADRPIAVNLIDNKIILFLKDGYSAEDRCGMGTTKVGFAPNGDIYPCERFIGQGNGFGLCIGNLRKGIDLDRLAAIQERTGNHNLECRKCVIERFCMNWCGCTNYYMTGYTNVASPVLCASEKAAVEAARFALTELADHDLFIDHLMEYLDEGKYPLEGGNYEGHRRKDHSRSTSARVA
jgi:uncharacterized protein